MRTDNSTDGRKGLTFLEAARRSQIIDAAIDVVNAVGFARTSLSRIAAQAGTSKSVVSYHFDGKEELLEQVVERVFGEVGDVVLTEVEKESGWSAKLAAYVRAELAVMRDHRARILAAHEIVISHRRPDGTPAYLEHEGNTALLDAILRGGQQTGEFGSFDVRVASVTVTHAVDGALTLAQKDPTTDLDSHAQHLVPLLLRLVDAREVRR